MIRLRTETQPGHGSRPEPRDRPCCYGIAGSTVETSSPEVAFEGLEIPCDTQEDRQPMPRRRSAAPGTEEQVIFEGDVELGGGVRRGRTVRRGETVRFEVETLGDVTIAAGVSSCEVQVRPYPGVARGSRGWQELVAGPALTLPLTLDGVVCLHASGVLAPAGAVAFFGSSGQGKSTLAVGLGAELPRIADDILPLARVTKTSRAGFVALPRFPQLKLPPAQRVSPDLPPRLPVAALFELETLPGEERLASLSVEPLPP
ncbi:MAG: hypothetical protein KDD11_21680, partial [Acidobacteria bacterium]|nr:hypothetical protein [Acidobacteriota bacterium]